MTAGGGHSRDTQMALAFSESFRFNFNYTCISIVPLSIIRLSLVGDLVSKVSSEYFITDLSGLGG